MQRDESDDIATSAGEDDKLPVAKPVMNDGSNSEEGENEEGRENEEDEGDTESTEEEDDYDEEEMDGFGFGEYDEEDEEDEGPPETEVEIMEESFNEMRLTFKIFLAEDDDEFISWMSTIYVHCTYNGEIIGRGYGRYIKRGLIRSTFWRDMEEPSQDLSTIAFEVFDRYGRLKKEFKDHPIRKGTGAWGSELDVGCIFVIEDILVDKQWRRRGIGKRVAEHLLDKSRKGRTPQFSLVVPGWLTRDIWSDLEGKTKLEQREVRFAAADVATSFWRSLGFRRIGASCCLGLSADANHAAHKILPTEDFDPDTEHPDLDEDPKDDDSEWDEEPDKESWRLALLKTRLPLHHAATTLSDRECVEVFEAFKSSDKPSDEWVKVDRAAMNLLHIAAGKLKPQSVRWLLDISGHGDTLRSARDVNGNTPLEQLESKLDIKRTRREHGMLTVDISDNFPGFTDEVIDCIAALRRIKDPSPIERARLKFGCTCGSCIDGFLSPRMHFALLCQAEINHDMLKESIADGKMWCMYHDYLFTYVAPDIQRNFATNKSYREGFANLFGHAAVALRRNTSPTVTNILRAYEDAREWPPHTKNFFQRGGTVDSALRIIFDFAYDQDEWTGDGDHRDVFDEKINALPECRNDQEFGLVSLACGIQYSRSLYG
jgi:GNAT superfamily N-acetyltransferase